MWLLFYDVIQKVWGVIYLFSSFLFTTEFLLATQQCLIWLLFWISPYFLIMAHLMLVVNELEKHSDQEKSCETQDHTVIYEVMYRKHNG